MRLFREVSGRTAALGSCDIFCFFDGRFHAVECALCMNGSAAGLTSSWECVAPRGCGVLSCAPVGRKGRPDRTPYLFCCAPEPASSGGYGSPAPERRRGRNVIELFTFEKGGMRGGGKATRRFPRLRGRGGFSPLVVSVSMILPCIAAAFFIQARQHAVPAA